MDRVGDLLVRNREFARRRDVRHVPGPPSSRIAVVSCMDSRIDLFAVLGLREGEAHLIRNAGGSITDDVIRSLTLSQRYLGTDTVLVIQHTDCAMLSLTDERVREDLERTVGMAPPFEVDAFDDLEAHLLESMAELRRSRFLVDGSVVRGFVYDVVSGRLDEVVVREREEAGPPSRPMP